MSKQIKEKSAKKPKTGGTLKSVLMNACCIFTVTLFAVYILTTLFLGKVTFTTNIGNTAAIFALALAAAASMLIYRAKKLPFWGAHLTVFILLGILYYLIVVRLSGLHQKTSTAIVAMVLYGAIFAIVTAAAAIIRKRKKTKEDKISDENYKPRF